MSVAELSQVVVELGRHTATSVFTDHSAGLHDAIRKMALACDVDRSYIFEFDYIMGTMSNTHEWCADHIQPEISRLQDLPIDTFPWSLRHFEAGRYVSIPRVCDLPEEARAEREILSVQGIKSAILVPILSEHGLAGFIGFDAVRHHREWSENDACLLEVAAGFVSVALNRKSSLPYASDLPDTSSESQWVASRVMRLASVIDDTVILHDVTGRVLTINEAGQRRLGIVGSKIEGLSVFDIQCEVPRDELLRSWKIMRPGDVFRKSGRHKTALGDSFPTHSVVSCFSDSGSKLFLAITRDTSTETEARQELLQSYQRLRDLTLHSQSVEYEARKNIARILHDGIGHDLARMKLMLQSARPDASPQQLYSTLRDCLPVLDHAISAARDVMRRALPPALTDRGLIPAINILADSLFKYADAELQLHTSGDCTRVSDELALYIYDAAAELLRNALTHASPTTVKLHLQITPTHTHLNVSHDGIDATTYANKTAGLGMSTIREKAAMYGGEAQWTLAEDQSSIRCTIHIPHAAS